jgi:hypothetical protein
LVPLAVILGLLAAGAPLAAQAKKLLNVDKDGVAVHGYDPVAYFSEGKAAKGDRQFQSNYAGLRITSNPMRIKRPSIKNLPSMPRSTEVTALWG